MSGSIPTALSALIEMAHHYRYRVVCVDHLTAARTDHNQRVIFLPPGNSSVRHAMLLHELAEVLLRLPVAPEWHYPVTDIDEFHEVGKLVNLRARVAVSPCAREK